MSMDDMSENIKIFSNNEVVISLINKLWLIKEKNNDVVEGILNSLSGKEEDEIILALEHLTDPNIERLTDPYIAPGGKKSKKRKSRKNRKSRK